MKRVLSYRLALSALLLVMLLGGSASGLTPVLGPVPFTVAGAATSATGTDLHPEVDGKLVAWESWAGHTGTEKRSVKVKNIATNEVRTLPGTLDQRVPDVSGDLVVYQDNSAGNWDIKGYRWSTNSVFTIEGSTDNEVNPRIDGNIVVWQTTETDLLWYRDLDLNETHQLTGAGGSFLWDVDNGRVVVVDMSNDKVYVATPRAPGEFPEVADYVNDVTTVRMHGDRIALQLWDGFDSDALQLNFRTRVTTAISDLAGTQEREPDVFHDTFVWRIGDFGDYDLQYRRPGHLDSVIDGTEDYSEPSLYGLRIAFGRFDGVDDTDVMLASTTTKLAARTSGTNRYATAASASRAYFAKAENVVLCTGQNFPDALAAAPLARALDAPLLLTMRDSLPVETRAEITRLHATKVYVIGGTPAISAAVYSQVDAMSGVAVERIAGTDRYATSAKIAIRLEHLEPGLVHRAFFARGDNFPDALAVGPVASGAFAPILLVQTNAVPASVANAVDVINTMHGYVIGDTVAVSASTATKINSLMVANGAPNPIADPRISRWAGYTRYDTAVAVINNGLAKRWIDLDTLGVATGTNFPDALGGGAALGYYGSPVMLTQGTVLTSSASAFLAAHEYEIGRVDVFGGSDVVSASVFNAILAKIK